MTLHEAIEQLLKQTGRPMTTTEIAMEINKNKWYQKKDGTPIDPFQIHGRTKNYPNIFNRSGSTISLNGQPNLKVSRTKKTTIKQKPILTELSTEIALLEKKLMNEKNLKDRNHNIIYIGIASQSLSKRFLNQELRAKGHGTFFRSIGAILGYKPAKGSLSTKANKRNYTFPAKDKQTIIEWVNSNLIINWVVFNGDFETIETDLIQRHLPLLNLAKNPLPLKQLSDLRAECVGIANNYQP